MDIRDTHILITGGGRGIGRYMAEHFSQVGKNVFVLDRDGAALDELASPNIYKYVCDITDQKSVDDIVQSIFKEHGFISVLINNAGIIHSEPLVNLLSRPDMKHNVNKWKQVIDINLNGVFYMGSSVAQRMIINKVKGVIINISSISAQGNIGQSAYSASKAAVEALTKTWSKELGMFKIRCACIAPGFFDTPSTRESLSEAVLEKWRKAVPLAKLGELRELASAVEFIVSNDYYNGKILALDGGLTI